MRSTWPSAVPAKMEQLKSRFPQGPRLRHSLRHDAIRLRRDQRSLLDAWPKPACWCCFVILMFLQDWRAVLVPATTVPVTIIGAFAAMYALGFTINLLTMFGLILAIGIVVDDAIVIVENASHHIESGLPPKEATIKAMSELLGPIIGITLVLTAVFLPASFLGGITGQLYRQFALTIAATAVISAINALTLKPAQCATYLRRPSGRPKFIVFRWFNAGYNRVEQAYARAGRWVVRHTAIDDGRLRRFCWPLAAWGFLALPTGFLPTEDQGYFIISAQLPDAASQESHGRSDRQTESSRRGRRRAWKMSMRSTGKTCSTAPFLPMPRRATSRSRIGAQRKTAAESQAGVLSHLQKEFAKIPNARILAFPPPAIRGLGVVGRISNGSGRYRQRRTERTRTSDQRNGRRGQRPNQLARRSTPPSAPACRNSISTSTAAKSNR